MNGVPPRSNRLRRLRLAGRRRRMCDYALTQSKLRDNKQYCTLKMFLQFNTRVPKVPRVPTFFINFSTNIFFSHNTLRKH